MEGINWFGDYLKKGYGYKPHTDEGRYWKYSHKMVSEICKELKENNLILNKKIARLKDFGIWIGKTDTINLAKDIYTEGGKNAEVHSATYSLKRQVRVLEKNVQKIRKNLQDRS